MAALLDIQNLRASYGPVEVLHGISLSVEPGEIVTLIGANGAGKTTTLMSISGAMSRREGSIRFGGQPIDRLATHAIVKLGLCHSPEGRQIFPRLTVAENLKMGFYARGRRQANDRLEQCYSLFPVLRERASQAGGTLSGGEQQMLALARALMSSPRLLMLDEPSLGLAPLVVRQIFAVISGLIADGMGILLVEQNAQLALRCAHRAYILEAGSILTTGPSAELLDDQRVKRAYLGE